jgi:hypothetical protein
MYTFRKQYEKEREIGIEIEMEGENIYIDNTRVWRSDGDGSLRGEATEYILTHPIPIETVENTLQTLIDTVRKQQGRYTFNPSDRCGVHVHINVQHMTFNELFNFMFLYLLMEKVLVSYCGESREGNLYCLRSSDAEYFIDRIIDVKRYSELDYLTKNDRNELRYSSMNPEAIRKFGSVEFRSLRTPHNLLDIKEWVDILYQVKTASLMFDEPKSFIEHYSFRGEEGFFKDIMGEKLAKVLYAQVPEVDQKVLDGIRLTQDIAYTPSIQHPATNMDVGMQPRRNLGERLRENVRHVGGFDLGAYEMGRLERGEFLPPVDEVEGIDE